MEYLHSRVIEERLQIIEKLDAYKAQRSNWIDKNGNLKKRTRAAEMGYLIAFVIFFNLIIIPKILFLLGIDTFLRNLYEVNSTDLFTFMFILLYFDIMKFRMLWGHRQELLSLQNTTSSTDFLYVLNNELSEFAKFKWKYAVLIIIMIFLIFFNLFIETEPNRLDYVGILSPIIIVLAFMLSFQHFQQMRQNIQQFEQFFLVDNNVQLSNVKSDI